MRGEAQPSFEVIMEMLSLRYGWTPQQIREMDTQDIASYIEIISIRRQIEKAENKQNGRQ